MLIELLVVGTGAGDDHQAGGVPSARQWSRSVAAAVPANPLVKPVSGHCWGWRASIGRRAAPGRPGRDRAADRSASSRHAATIRPRSFRASSLCGVQGLRTATDSS